MGDISACSPSCDKNFIQWSVTSDHWMKLKSGCRRENAFAILITNFPFPPSPFPHFSPSLFICPDLIICHSCKLNWLIFILFLEQCQSWQHGNQQRYMMKRSEKKNGWRSWISLLPKMQPNEEPQGRTGHEGSKSQSYSEGSKLCSACVCRGCCSLRCSQFYQPGYIQVQANQQRAGRPSSTSMFWAVLAWAPALSSHAALSVQTTTGGKGDV